MKKRNIWESFDVWKKTGRVEMVGSFGSYQDAAKTTYGQRLFPVGDGPTSLVYKNGDFFSAQCRPDGEQHNLPLCRRLVEGRGLYAPPADRA